MILILWILKFILFIHSFSKYNYVHAPCRSCSSYNCLIFESVLRVQKDTCYKKIGPETIFQVSRTYTSGTYWKEMYINLALNSSRAFSCLVWRIQNKHSFDFNKYIKTKLMFYTLPLSLKILLNLCLLSCK